MCLRRGAGYSRPAAFSTVSARSVTKRLGLSSASMSMRNLPFCVLSSCRRPSAPCLERTRSSALRAPAPPAHLVAVVGAAAGRLALAVVEALPGRDPVAGALQAGVVVVAEAHEAEDHVAGEAGAGDRPRQDLVHDLGARPAHEFLRLGVLHGLGARREGLGRQSGLAPSRRRVHGALRRRCGGLQRCRSARAGVPGAVGPRSAGRRAEGRRRPAGVCLCRAGGFRAHRPQGATSPRPRCCADRSTASRARRIAGMGCEPCPLAARGVAASGSTLPAARLK